MSGIIFVVLAVAWAVYLIPKAVKHHDDAAPARSVDRFSTAMRVLARRDPEESPAAPDRPRRADMAVRRAAARAAARRRRRVTSVLLMADVAVAALATLLVVPWWSVVVPVALTVVFLALCRRQVRRENDALWAPKADSAAPGTPPRRAVRVDSAYGSAHQAALADAHGPESADAMQIPVTDGEAVPVAAATVDGGSLWDPLPVTLPTYVNKARASRTVRTIDLGAPGTWTSGRDEADSALVGEPPASEAPEDTVEHEPWRAVGS